MGLAILVNVKANPARRAEFLKGIEEATAHFRQETGCLRFDVIEDSARPNQFYFYELWRDEAALEEHRNSPHLAAWAAKRDAGLVDGPLQSTRMQVVFPAELK